MIRAGYAAIGRRLSLLSGRIVFRLLWADRPPFFASAKSTGKSAFAIQMRRKYRIDMAVSRQARKHRRATAGGPRARMKRILLDTAMNLMQQGLVPSVSDVAEAANV
ncbi:MAG: hypothetical protein NUV72_00485, partial [Bauldia sp.]|nr:hypothetical protein [Bauldia sp.]